MVTKLNAYFYTESMNFMIDSFWFIYNRAALRKGDIPILVSNTGDNQWEITSVNYGMHGFELSGYTKDQLFIWLMKQVADHHPDEPMLRIMANIELTAHKGSLLIDNKIKRLRSQIVNCERCGVLTDEVYPCEKCETLICERCSSPFNQFTQIDYTCCKECGLK